MISVVMATHNGMTTLPLAMEAFKGVRPPDGGVEFILVDNSSGDATRGFLDQFLDALPLTVLSEPRKGKSFALNKAIGAARGELIVFADDDVLPEAQWLLAFSQAAAAYPDVDLFAGQVRHFWQKTPPRWLHRLAEEGRSYGGTPVDQPEGPVPATFFKGGNFMVRRRIIGSVRFSERPGVNFAGDAASAGGEDTAFVQEALSGSRKAHYVPGACVKHIVRPSQVGILPVFRRYLRIGRSMALSNREQFDPGGARLLGFPRYLFRTIPRDILRALRYWLSGNSYAAADQLIGVAMTCGRAQQWRNMACAVPVTSAENKPNGGRG